MDYTERWLTLYQHIRYSEKQHYQKSELLLLMRGIAERGEKGGDNNATENPLNQS